MLVLTGEAAQQEHVDCSVGSVHLINRYGPVESGNCTAYEYPNATSPANIVGRAMSGAICWIVDANDHNQLAAVGDRRALVEGPTLARGYLKQPEKMAAAFITIPFRELNSTGASTKRQYYKIADLAYHRHEGLLCFVGRGDLQVKNHGQRVDISEAECYLSKYPHVAKSAVAYPQTGQFAGQLVAVVQLRRVKLASSVYNHIRLTQRDKLESNPFHPSEATAFLKDHIPGYMTPTAWLVVDHLLISMSGKGDRIGIERWFSLAYNKEWWVSRLCSEGFFPTPESNHIALKLGLIVPDLICQGDVKVKIVFEGKDIPSSALGIDYMQFITLLSYIYIESTALKLWSSNSLTLQLLFSA
ncbi:MAG: hypothetical protein Q9209_005496 [Squamulea sp. 1 TL-2023]